MVSFTHWHFPMNNATDYADSILVFTMSKSRVQACYILLFSHFIQSTVKCFPFKSHQNVIVWPTFEFIVCLSSVEASLFNSKMATDEWHWRKTHISTKKVAPPLVRRDTPFVRKKNESSLGFIHLAHGIF